MVVIDVDIEMMMEEVFGYDGVYFKCVNFVVLDFEWLFIVYCDVFGFDFDNILELSEDFYFYFVFCIFKEVKFCFVILFVGVE